MKKKNKYTYAIKFRTLDSDEIPNTYKELKFCYESDVYDEPLNSRYKKKIVYVMELKSRDIVSYSREYLKISPKHMHFEKHIENKNL